MNLIDGAKWSDGDPFDAEDVRFWWEDNVLDENVPTRMNATTMGEGTSLKYLVQLRLDGHSHKRNLN